MPSPSIGGFGRAPVRHTGRAPRARTSAASATSRRTRLPDVALRVGRRFEAHLDAWTREIADLRVHGTTGEVPIERFRRAEAGALRLDRRHSALRGEPRAGAQGAGRLRHRSRRQRLFGAVAADRRDGARHSRRRAVARQPCRPARSPCTSAAPAASSGCIDPLHFEGVVGFRSKATVQPGAR